MILQAIRWPQPRHTADSEDSDADDMQPEKLNLITGFLKTFVEHGKIFVLQHGISEIFITIYLEYTKHANIFVLFISGSPNNLKKLMKFWVGWEVVPRTLNLEIVQSTGQNQLPKAYTCYERLRLPDHYTSLSAFTADMMVCLQSVESGFGLV